MKLILGSKSPRRSDLLRRFGLKFEVDQADIDETLSDNRPIEKQVAELAYKKAAAVAARHIGAYVLAADTIVLTNEPGTNREVLGKPSDAAEATRMLEKLSGKTHQVLTAYCILEAQSGTRREHLVRTSVRFRELSAAMIQAYVATGEPLDKAGAYGIQGFAEGFVESISGSYSNVVGLPIAEVLGDLENLGLWSWGNLSEAVDR